MDPRDIFNRLVFIFPDLRLDEAVMNYALGQGWITKEAYEIASKYVGAIATRGLKGALVHRITSLVPELMSVEAVDLLRKFNLIGVKEGHALRVALNAVGAIRSAVVSEATILERIFKVSGGLVSQELVDLIGILDKEEIAAARAALAASPNYNTPESRKALALWIEDKLASQSTRAQMIRNFIAGSNVALSTVMDLKRANNVWSAVYAVADNLFGKELLQAAVRAGVIAPEMYNTIRALEDLGLSAWRRGSNAFSYEGWIARSLAISEGIFSREMVVALQTLGYVTPQQAWWMQHGVTAIRSTTRSRLEVYRQSHFFRVNTGESPLQTYARVSRGHDKALLKMLEEAAQRSSKTAEELMKSKKFGDSTRAAQQKLLQRELHKEMRNVAENMGPLVIFGEKETASAAVRSMEYLQRELLGRMSDSDRRSLIRSARSGLDAYVSRQENMLPLSRRVYKNYALWTNRIDREIDIALTRGLSAREFAQALQRFISPKAPGGVSYSAMRLARTEINNSFHWTAIRYTREMPWVEGYQWHTSGSHPKPDICDEMAAEDHDDLGKGVYKKNNVPGKPHPQCFCYTTTVTDSPGQFERGMRTGKYKAYFDKVDREGVFNPEIAEASNGNFQQVWGNVYGQIGTDMKKAALSAAAAGAVIAVSNPGARDFLLSKAIGAATGTNLPRF